MPSVNNEVPQYELTFAKLTGSDVQSGERSLCSDRR